MNKIIIAYHPGEEIGAELEARGRSYANFSKLLGISVEQLNAIIHGKRDITPELAILIGEAFGTSAKVRLGMQNMYDLYRASKKKKLFNN